MLRCISEDAFVRASSIKQRVRSFRFLCTTPSREDGYPETILQALSPDAVTHLKHHGYAVQDNVLDSLSSSRLRSEINYLIASKLTSPNKTHILHRHAHKSASMQTYAKQCVIQAEVPHLPANVRVPYLRILNDDPSLAAYLNVYWPKLSIRDQAVKVQRATGRHGCFPIHVDSSPEADGRIVTALLYPHEDWADEGGALRVYHTPISHVDIAPAPGRLVLLSSRLMHHRVLPAERNRLAITLWLSGSVQRVEAAAASTSCIRTRVAHALLQPKFRDVAFRLALEQEWELSLSESHSSDEADVLIQQFRKSVDAIRQRLPQALCNELGLKDKLAARKVEEVLKTQQSIRNCYEELEDKNGEMAFVW